MEYAKPTMKRCWERDVPFVFFSFENKRRRVESSTKFTQIARPSALFIDHHQRTNIYHNHERHQRRDE